MNCDGTVYSIDYKMKNDDIAPYNYFNLNITCILYITTIPEC